MYVYADILLIINTAMNGLILFLTAWAAGLAYRVWRLLAAAFAGALYALGGVLAMDTLLYALPVKLAVAALLVRLAFGPRPWRPLLLATAYFYLVSFLLGGAVLGWLLLASSGPGVPFWPKVYWYHLAAGSLLALLLVGPVWRRLIAGLTRRPHLVLLLLGYGGRQISLTALLDTGNSLYTLSGRQPVILVEHRALEPLLPGRVNDYLRRTPPAAWPAGLADCPDAEWLVRVQLIPGRGVGGQTLLLAFRPDTIVVGGRTAASAAVAIHSGRLSSDDTYRALLHPALMQDNELKKGADICA